MPDPDRAAREMMDTPGTRVTPEADEHPTQLPGHKADGSAGAGEAGASKGQPADRPGISRTGVVIGEGGADFDAHQNASHPIGEPEASGDAPGALPEGGTGTSGSRGGGPAADFTDQQRPGRSE